MEITQLDRVSQASEQRYRHLFENMPVCIMVADLTTMPVRILEVNRRAELVYGYTAAELVGRPVVNLLSEESHASVQNIWQRVRQGETVTAEIVNRHRDGTTFPVRVIVALDPADSGRMMMTVEDITAAKQRRSEAEAIEAERRRIAREIHDGVAQNLAGLRFKSAVWLAGSISPAMRAAVNEIQAVLNTAVIDIRRAIFALRPVDLDALGFVPALTQLVTDFGDQNQLVARLNVSGPHKAVPANYELPLFRVIQEGLNNISQHARAHVIEVRLAVGAAGDVAVAVRDDGCGFDPYQLGSIEPSGHFGLRQMRERIVDLGGTLDIHSTIGQGTELIISLPPIGMAHDLVQSGEVTHVTD